MDVQKKAYVGPKVTDFGTFANLTKGQSTGTELDSSFPIGTDFSNLSFS